jgi:hypothetical protein
VEKVERRIGHFTRLALLLSGSLAGCAAPIYLHSPSLETATAKASTSLPDTATALKPFDDQFAALTAFAAREDLAVAQYWTTVRDAHFQQILALDVETDRRAALRQLIDNRLAELIGSDANNPTITNLLSNRQRATEHQARADRDVEFYRQSYRRANPEVEERELTCDTVLAAIPVSDRARLSLAPGREGILAMIANACAVRAEAEVFATQSDDQIDALHGMIGRARAELHMAEQKTSSMPNPRTVELQAQILRAAAFDESASPSAQLRTFRETLRNSLNQVNEATGVAALQGVSDELDTLLKGEICDSPAVSDEAKSEAGCAEVTPASSAGRARAAWALARALAELASANGQDRRSVQWLTAAKAIVAGEKAEARLRLEEAAAEASAIRQRLAALLREMSELAAARQALLTPRTLCHGGTSGSDRTPNPRCSFAAYVDAWNEGRIPVEVLRYRPVQIQRSYAVLRSRAVAQRQYALASAGAASLRDYGAGGIRANEIAQAAFDLAVIGLIPGE